MENTVPLKVSSFRLFMAFLIFAILPLSSCAPRLHTSRTYTMGTYCSVTEELEGKEEGDLSPLLFPLLEEIEGLLSHKVDGSVSDLLNGLDYVVIPNGHRARLTEELRLAEQIKEKTGGLFSLSVLPITSLWDFGNESAVPPSPEDIATALAEMKDSALSFEDDIIRKTGGDIDLGAIGKGYACDVLRDALPASKSALISIGGSIAAVGRKSSGEAWQIGVRDPFSSSKNATLGTLSLTDAFVSTSGSYEKCFTHEGKLYHHILDPRTGSPCESDLVSVTVVAGKGTLTDMLSTACFLVGSDAAFSLAAQYGAGIIAVKTDGTLLVSAALSDIFTPKAGWEPQYR